MKENLIHLFYDWNSTYSVTIPFIPSREQLRPSTKPTSTLQVQSQLLHFKYKANFYTSSTKPTSTTQVQSQLLQPKYKANFYNPSTKPTSELMYVYTCRYNQRFSHLVGGASPSNCQTSTLNCLHDTLPSFHYKLSSSPSPKEFNHLRTNSPPKPTKSHLRESKN